MGVQKVFTVSEDNLSLDLASLEDMTLSRELFDLVITSASGDQMIYKDFFDPTGSDLLKQLILSDGTVVSIDQIEDLIALGSIAPAAGPAAGGTGGGAGFEPSDPGSIGDGISIEDLLGRTELNFNLASLADIDQFTVEEGTPEEEREIPDSACLSKFNAAVDGFLDSWKAPVIPADAIDDSDIEVETSNLMVGDHYYYNSSNFLSYFQNFNQYSNLDRLPQYNDLLDLSDQTQDVTLVGDIMLETDDASIGSNFHFSPSFDSQSNDTLLAFNDILIGGAGNDVLVGDMLAIINDEGDISDTTGTGVGLYEADDKQLIAFNDSLVGGAGNDILVGDKALVIEGSGSISSVTSFSNCSYENNNNTINQFNDILDAGSGDDLLVGDIFLQNAGSNEVDYYVGAYGGNYMGDGNDVNVFNDDLSGGEGQDILVGDVFAVADESEPLSASINVFGSNYRASGNEYTTFSDVLDGGADDDLLVGDVLSIMGDSSSINQDISVGGSFYEGDGNSFSAFNDLMDGGEGDDVLVGDVAMFGEGASGFYPNVNVTNCGYNGSDNSFEAFNDIMDGGEGADLIVGDFLLENNTSSGSTVSINVVNSFTEGENNNFDVFSDIIYAGDSDGDDGPLAPGLQAAFAGSVAQVIDRADFGIAANPDVGDDSQAWMSINGTIDPDTDVDLYRVELKAGETITLDIDYGENAGNDPVDMMAFLMDADGVLLISNDDNGTGNGGGGSVNSHDSYLTHTVPADGVYYVAVSSFNNDAIAGTGDDFGGFDGDGYSSGDYVLNISVDGDGFGENPQVIEEIDGSNVPTSADATVVVGDFYISDPSDTDINIDLHSYLDPEDGNSTGAFNDGIVGSKSGDVLVGDLVIDNDSDVNFTLNIEGRDGLTAFSDHICGGEGGDLIVGDFLVVDGDLDTKLPMYMINEYRGEKYEEEQREDAVTLFQDTLMGEGGDDTLVGGLGHDTLSGGEGDDSFIYNSLYEDGHDVITDYEAGDVVDLDALFDELGINDSDDRADAVAIEQVDGDSVLTIGEEEPYPTFSITFEDVLLTEGNSDILEAQGILVGDSS